MKNVSSLLIVLLALAGIGLMVRSAISHTNQDSPQTLHPDTSNPDLKETIAQVDQYFIQDWEKQNINPAQPADDLQVLRRLSLGLMGTIPSLEEIRAFTQDQQPQKLERWVDMMLDDPRFHSYLAERLARSYVGIELTPFIVFRRDRFHSWLSEQLRENRPYDQIVRELVSGVGVWTGKPEVNFITQTINNNRVDVNTLTGRTVRAFLGQRIDCAQCHDHPFAHWKQQDFEGLAAFYGRTKISVAGITDKNFGEYEVEDRKTLEKKAVTPRVPYHAEWLDNNTNRRIQLANWITHPDNRQFERAIVNRLWAVLVGRPWSRGAPYNVAVDDLPDPPNLEKGEAPDLLDILGKDFREHGYDLRRTIRVITASKVFRLSSIPQDQQLSSLTDPSAKKQRLQDLEDHWAVFPLIRLRPEQVIGSMLQASSIKTIDLNSHLLTRIVRFMREKDFINEYGDFGADEFVERSATIPQSLLTMNGKLVAELSDDNPLSSVLRVTMLSPNDRHAIETTYLVCLSRVPTTIEYDVLLPQLAELTKNQRNKWIEDLYWSLYNSPEFSWNH